MRGSGGERIAGVAVAAWLGLAAGSGLLAGCRADVGPAPFDRARAEEALRDVLRQERDAHLARDATRFVAGFADSMTSVNRGVVSRLSREDYRARFQSYFDAVTFEAWDDRAPARILMSDDGTLATVVVEKTVRTREGDEVATTEFAWVSVYRHAGGRWRLECNASTNR